MKPWKLLTLVSLLCVGWASQARADYVADMAKMVRTHRSYKVRMTALVALSRYETPQIAELLMEVLNSRKQHPLVRGMAARLLAKMKALFAIPLFRKLARTRNRRLRRIVREAMLEICPRSTRGKKFYVNFSRSKAEGPHTKYARNLAIMEMARYLAKKRPDVLLGWPRCRKPTRRMLRRRRVKGYYIHMTLRVKKQEGGTFGSMNLLYTTFPKNSIKGMTSMEARTPIKPEASVVSFLTKSLAQAMFSSVNQFLQP